LVKQNCINSNYKIIQDDAFTALQNLVDGGEKFDLISIDPPPFTKSQRDKPKALTAHYKLITLMDNLLAKGGIGFYSTCSHHIVISDIVGIISKVFKKDFELIATLGQPKDHPIRSDFKEGKYLNTVIFKKLK
jgi:23S rRNA (cytosine1962-C5)-methyltransferase